MKPMSWKWLAAGLALMAAFSATAQVEHRRMPPRQAGGDGRSMHHQLRADIAQREAVRQEHQHAAGRMSPEERRQLRRDIHDAGRELYPRDSARPLP